MISALPGIGALSELILTIVDAMGILKPFQAIFDVIMGLFGTMGAEIIPVLMLAIQPLIGYLMELRPLFQAIGEVIGMFLMRYIEAFLPLLDAWFEVMKPFLPLFIELIPLLELQFALLYPFLPLLRLLIPLIELLEPGIWAIVYALRTINPAIRTATAAISNLIGWIEDLAKVAQDISGGGSSGGGGGGGWNPWTGVIEIPSFQTGARSVSRTGLAIVDEGEEIKPAQYVGVQEALLTELIDVTKKKNEQDYFQNAFVRRRR